MYTNFQTDPIKVSESVMDGRTDGHFCREVAGGKSKTLYLGNYQHLDIAFAYNLD